MMSLSCIDNGFLDDMKVVNEYNVCAFVMLLPTQSMDTGQSCNNSSSCFTVDNIELACAEYKVWENQNLPGTRLHPYIGSPR